MFKYLFDSVGKVDKDPILPAQLDFEFLSVLKRLFLLFLMRLGISWCALPIRGSPLVPGTARAPLIRLRSRLDF
jgi:hypothetical protein